MAEVGNNVNAFATPDKLTAWVGLAPGNKESAGKSFYSDTRDGNKYLRTAMLQVAWERLAQRRNLYSDKTGTIKPA